MSSKPRLRVLLAFDDGQPDRRLLERLPNLLDSEQVELSGLFVEDEDLLRAAALPGLREISLSGEIAPLDVEPLRERLARQAASMRRTLEAVAAELRTAHSFQVLSGRAADELCRAAQACDFVLVTRSLRTSGLRARSGRYFAALARQPCSALFVNEPWGSGSTVVVLGGAPDALALARRFAAAENLELVELAPERWDEDAIAEACQRLDARLLVLPRQAGLDSAELLVQLMDRLPCSLLQLA